MRFESGERRGEVVPILVDAAAGGVFTVGRRPGNSLQVTDGSVSGRHAEVQVSAAGVSIRDLGSTNGTLFGGRKVPQADLGHGDRFSLGAVEFTLLDQSQAGTPGLGTDELTLEDPGELVLEGPGELVLEEPSAAPMPTKRAVPAPAPATVAPPGAPPGAPPAAPPAARPAAPIPADAMTAAATPAQDDLDLPEEEDSLVITADDLARSRKSSKLGPLLVVVLAAAGAGAWWWMGKKADDSSGRSRASAAVVPVAGNLLQQGYSFEKTDGWSSDETRSAVWDPVRSASRSGRNGIRAELFGGDDAVITSDPVRLSGGSRSVEAIGQVRGDGDAAVRLGLRFTSSGEGAASTTVWSEAVSGAEDWTELTLRGTAPRGFDRVSVVVRGEGSGDPPPTEEGGDGVPAEIDVDDVALVPADAAGLRLREHDEWSMAVAGEGAGGVLAVALSALDEPMVSSLRVLASGDGLDGVPLTLGGEGGTFELTPAGAGELLLRAEGELVSAGLATLGARGYVAHGTSFELAEADSLLLGADARLVRIACSQPVGFSARPAGDDVVLRAALPAGATLSIQVEFSQERTQAERMARQAGELRKRGERGAALGAWQELLASVPFDAALVERAITEQAELESEARDALKALEGELERARFFGLPGLFEEKLAHARALADEYAGAGDTETRFRDAAAGIERELDGLKGESDRHERMRLEAISTVLKNDGADDLVRRLEEYAERLEPAGGEER